VHQHISEEIGSFVIPPEHAAHIDARASGCERCACFSIAQSIGFARAHLRGLRINSCVGCSYFLCSEHIFHDQEAIQIKEEFLMSADGV
jgi:hypothetical protein